MNSLYEALHFYGNTDAYPFHMPGHKRNLPLLKDMCGGNVLAAYEIDITEIDGFDNLHHAEGILKEAQDRASELYGSKESFFLINGSTCGLLAAVFACTEQRGAILMARNCHKAVYHAAELRELKTLYLYPESLKGGQINGVIDPQEVEEQLKHHPEVSAVLLTSPTYDGMVSDIGEIAKIVHGYGKYLIVDEAHGAHLGFHTFFPENSLKKGADLVIHSLHKTLPSMTQTALLQIGKDSDISPERVKKYLGMFETSSPSYVMMAGMDLCIRYLQEKKEELFENFVQRLRNFYQKTQGLKHIHVLQEENQDLSKLVIFADGHSGQEVADILRKRYHLEMEMAAKGYVIALTSIFDTDQGFARLIRALEEIDKEETDKEETDKEETDPCTGEEDLTTCWRNEVYCRISEASQKEGKEIPIEKSEGKISAEYMYLYPPGIPLIVPGEAISAYLIGHVKEVQKLGFEVQGLRDHSGKRIHVLDI